MLALIPTFQKESLTITLAEGSAIPLPGTYPKQLRTSAHTSMLTVALFTTPEGGAKSKRSLTDDGPTNHGVCVHRHPRLRIG